MPDENNAFKEFVSRIEAKGGGDEPENGLEALGLAMRSDWVKEGTSKRHIIVLFTDASAHSLEDERRSQVENYPDNMFNTYDEMLEAWNGEEQGTCMDTDARMKVDQRAKRLILFAPDSDVWTNIATDFEQTMMLPTILADGCSEVDKEMIINSLSKSTK